MALLRLELTRLLRNTRLLVFTLVFPAGFYLLYTQMYSAQMRLQGTTWASYYMVSMAVFGAVGAALSTLGTRLAAERAGGWVRLLRTTPLGAVSYVGAKLMAAVLAAVPATLLLMLLGALVNHVALTASAWLELFLIVVACSIPFAALGLLLGYLFDSESAQAGQVLIWLVLSLLGGLWAPLQAMPKVFSEIALYLPTFRAADLARLAVGAAAQPILQDIAVLLAYTLVLGAAAWWRYQSDAQREYA